MGNVEFEIGTSRELDSGKVVEVLVRLQGAKGQTTVDRYFSWDESQRYTCSDSGKRIPKTGADYKEEIRLMLEAEFSPKK